MRLSRERAFILFGLSIGERSFKGLGLLVLYFFGALLFAAVFSPFIYWGIQAWAEASPNGVNTYILKKGLAKIFDRLRWLPVILTFPWFLKKCGLWSWQSLGLSFRPFPWRSLLYWFCFGILLLAFIAAAQAFTVGLESKEQIFSWNNLIAVSLMAVLSGILVGLLEEVVFRGMILRMFYTAVSPLGAVLLSSLFFAFVHFKKIPDNIWTNETAVTLGSGFYLALWTTLSVVETFDALRFLNLFLSGLVLSLLFLRTRSLWTCVGLHAGWVWFRLVYKKFIEAQGHAPHYLWGSEIIIDGLLTAFLLLALALYLLFRNGPPIHQDSLQSSH